jgi:hypothetical protein
MQMLFRQQGANDGTEQSAAKYQGKHKERDQ